MRPEFVSDTRPTSWGFRPLATNPKGREFASLMPTIYSPPIERALGNGVAKLQIVSELCVAISDSFVAVTNQNEIELHHHQIVQAVDWSTLPQKGRIELEGPRLDLWRSDYGRSYCAPGLLGSPTRLSNPPSVFGKVILFRKPSSLRGNIVLRRRELHRDFRSAQLTAMGGQTLCGEAFRSIDIVRRGFAAALSRCSNFVGR